MSTEAGTDLNTACGERRRQRMLGRRVVFTNGCFDLLHPGHVRLLEQARQFGDYLVVGLNSDVSVRAIKGPRRPLLPQAHRATTLAALEMVDCVVLYDDTTPQHVIEALLPDVLVKGADWAEEAIVGREAVLRAGGRVERIPLLSGRSTTELLERIRGR